MPQVWYTWCNTMQYNATHCNTYLQQTATQCNTCLGYGVRGAIHCNTLQRISATRCKTYIRCMLRCHASSPSRACMYLAATHCNTYFRYGVCCTDTRQVARGSACISLEHADTLLHTATRCNTHTATHISGMVYVALSRVKSLEGLRLHGFAPAKVSIEHTHVNIHIYPLIHVEMYTYRYMFLIYI